MWGYYGSKSKVVSYYPEPRYDTIIEPFCGTAQYALRYWDRDVYLVDKYDIIVRIWKWLQRCSPNDILGLPRLSCGDNVEAYKWDCDEAKWLMGFIIVGASATPKKTASRWKTVVRPNTQEYKLNYIANNLHKIRHWTVSGGSYEAIPNREATWFIDPPYQVGGKYYKYGNRHIDYDFLAAWCKNRMGQVIVCESNSADWLPFTLLSKMRGNRYVSSEMVYTQ